MKKSKILILPLLLAPIAIVSLNQAPSLIKAEAKYTPNKYSETAEVYYKDVDVNAHPYQLLAQIKDLTDINHKDWCTWNDFGKYENYRYTDYYIGKQETHFRDFYSLTPQPMEWNGRKYSREHVWCANASNKLWGRDNATEDGKDHSSEGAGLDVHHIRPLLQPLNSSRSDRPFTEYGVDKREPRLSSGGLQFGWNPTDPSISSEYFEPLDDIKGDIARILMYVFVHYNLPHTIGKHLPSPTDQGIGDPSIRLNNGVNLVRRGDLMMEDIIVKDCMKTPTPQTSFELLLKWHNQDKVDQYEINRNNAAYGMQGNRNPFIDHPEWADIVFASDINNDSQPPVTPDSGTETPDLPSTTTPDDTNNKVDTKIIIIAAVAGVVFIAIIIAITIVVYKKKHK